MISQAPGDNFNFSFITVLLDVMLCNISNTRERESVSSHFQKPGSELKIRRAEEYF